MLYIRVLTKEIKGHWVNPWPIFYGLLEIDIPGAVRKNSSSFLRFCRKTAHMQTKKSIDIAIKNNGGKLLSRVLVLRGHQ